MYCDLPLLWCHTPPAPLGGGGVASVPSQQLLEKFLLPKAAAGEEKEEQQAGSLHTWLRGKKFVNERLWAE